MRFINVVVLVCKTESGGLCNVHGGVNCSSCGKTCKTGYVGDQCQSCAKGYKSSNPTVNGIVSKNGIGNLCDGNLIVTKISN